MPFHRAKAARSTFLIALLTVCSLAQAQRVSAKHSQIELISKQDGIAPGGTALLGIHFTLEPGWHIYWINPGDSGQPPEFRWQLPQGFTAGEIEWPRPERMQSTPELADFGYHDGVLLMVPLHAPQATPAKTADIEVQAKWLICREVCLPDRAQLHLALPVKRGPGDAAGASSFNDAQKLVPKPPPRSWRINAVSHQDAFVLSVQMGKSNGADRVEFFPLNLAQVDNAAAQKISRSDNGMWITLKKSEQLVKPVSVLRGVLVLDGAAYTVAARIRPPGGSENKKSGSQ
jgi:DsbC/DsbD-like thiol-disulfide interchange protein